METLQVMVIVEDRASKVFNGRQLIILVWELVPDADGVVNGEWPQVCLCCLWPVNGEVHEHCAAHVEYCLNVPFSVILVMSADSGERNCLLLISAVRFPVL